MIASVKRFLLFIVKVAVCIGIVMAAGFAIVDRIKKYNETGAVLTKRIFEMESILASKEEWEQRSLWIDQNVPRYRNREVALNALMDNVRETIIKHELDLEYRDEVVEMPGEGWSDETDSIFDQASIEVIVSGSEKKIIHWIHDLQQPAKFTGIDRVAIEVDELGINCEVQVTQWYRGERGIPSFDLIGYSE